MSLFKKSIIFFIVFAIVANLSLGVFEREPKLSLRAELLVKIKLQYAQGEGNPDDFKYITPGESGGGGGSSQSGSGSAVCAAIPNIGGMAWGVVATPICQALDLAFQASRFAYERAKGVWDKLESSLRDTIAKRILDYIVDQTVKWIQGGGKPKFIGNWEGFLKDVGDIAFDSVASEIKSAYRRVDLCSPFGLQVKMSFLPVEKFSERIKCSLDNFVNNIENFYVDFSVGGWDGYLASLEPNNNFHGVILMAMDEIAKRTAEKKDAAKSAGIASKGFLSVTRCKTGTGVSYNTGNLKEYFENPANYETTGFNWLTQCSSIDDPDIKKLCESDAKSSWESYMKNSGYKEATSGEYCASENLENTTPGALVGDVVAHSMKTDSEWAANIQRWTAALVNAVINRLLKKGLAAMDSSEKASPSRYYPPEYESMVNQTKLQEDLTLINQIKPMQKEWDYLLKQKGNSLVYAREILSTLRELQASNCTSTNNQLVTGADIDNVSSIIDNLQLKIDALQSRLDKSKSLIDQINSAQTHTEKAEAQFAFNNFLNTYNTVDFQQQIVSGSGRDAADKQTADLLKQLKGENHLVVVDLVEVMINDGLRQRLSDCRASQASGQQSP